jgi:hypothetical protein
MYDIVEHEIPPYQLRKAHDIEGFKKSNVQKIGQLYAFNSDYIDKASEWVEEKLSETLHRQNQERKNEDWFILLLFRLLAIKYRIKNSVKGRKLKIEYSLRIFLEMWICRAGVE